MSLWRTNRRGDGVALYLRESLDFEVITDYSFVTHRYEFLVFKCFQAVIALIYRPF